MAVQLAVEILTKELFNLPITDLRTIDIIVIGVLRITILIVSFLISSDIWNSMRNVISFGIIIWESVFTIQNLNAIFSFYDVGLGSPMFAKSDHTITTSAFSLSLRRNCGKLGTLWHLVARRDDWSWKKLKVQRVTDRDDSKKYWHFKKIFCMEFLNSPEEYDLLTNTVFHFH